MTDLDQVLKVGTLLVIETGEYSDFSSAEPGRLLVDCVKRDLVDQFRREWTPQYRTQSVPEACDFLPWLIKTGKAEAIDNVHSWHVGSYGRFEP